MPISWKNYLALRKITAEQYISSRGIKNYESLVSSFNKKDVVPPDLSEVSSFFAKDKPRVEKKVSTENLLSPSKKTNSDKKLTEEKSSSEASAKVDISQRKPRSPRRRARKSSAKSKT